MNDLYLIAHIAGQRVALATEAIDSVVHVTHTTSVPLAPPHLMGLAALRSRVITMIDTRIALGLDPAEPRATLTTVVVNLDGHQYGLVVDMVEDVCAIAGVPAPVRSRLGAGWARASLGLLDHDGASLLLIDPAMLAAGNLALAA
ncbi:chemotaxis protein CheW [Sphingomonas cavernae]|uniref:Chemotaxis protein CheW n=1 Tax=Sphingomonas cavernae TaxID=2320861 RepID=A0A418W630_9SPHN|nr:chemotaxis protein CheW [Sphingomonas cavernae]RJF85486.1 chemotaxis protein CheW [Sphingomonas cavernae]